MTQSPVANTQTVHPSVSLAAILLLPISILKVREAAPGLEGAHFLETSQEVEVDMEATLRALDDEDIPNLRTEIDLKHSHLFIRESLARLQHTHRLFNTLLVFTKLLLSPRPRRWVLALFKLRRTLLLLHCLARQEVTSRRVLLLLVLILLLHNRILLSLLSLPVPLPR